MKEWTSYNTDGSVESVFRGKAPIASELYGLSYIAGAVDHNTEYVDVLQVPPVKVAKQPVPLTQSATQITADGLDELDISGLPDPCVVVWPDGVTTEVGGGSIQYSIDYPGTYAFTLSSPIHLETGVSVEAVAAS